MIRHSLLHGEQSHLPSTNVRAIGGGSRISPHRSPEHKTTSSDTIATREKTTRSTRRPFVLAASVILAVEVQFPCRYFCELHVIQKFNSQLVIHACSCNFLQSIRVASSLLGFSPNNNCQQASVARSRCRIGGGHFARMCLRESSSKKSKCVAIERVKSVALHA